MTLSENWITTVVREAVISEDSKRKPVRASDRKPGPFPYYGASGIVDWVDGYLFDYPTLLVSEDGDNLKTRKTPIAFIANGKYWVNNHSHVMRARENFDLEFLAYALENTDISGFLTGSTQPKLTAANLGDIPLTLPSFAAQQRVATVLGSLDKLIQMNVQLAQVCSDLAENVWLQAVQGSSGEKRLDEVATIVLGGTPSRKNNSYWGGDIPWLNSGKANDFRVTSPSEQITELGLSKSSTKLMPRGATIIAITGATLGQVSRIEIPACGNQSLIGAWAEQPSVNDFIFFGVKNRIEVLMRSATGGAQQHVNKANVQELKIPWVSEPDLEEWHLTVAPLMQSTAELLLEAQSLKSVRNQLIPLLLSGRLLVEEGK